MTYQMSCYDVTAYVNKVMNRPFTYFFWNYFYKLHNFNFYPETIDFSLKPVKYSILCSCAHLEKQ